MTLFLFHVSLHWACVILFSLIVKAPLDAKATLLTLCNNVLTYIYMEKTIVYGTCGYAYLIIYLLIADQWFYWMHRIMHNGYLYNYVHYIHHRWVMPIPISAIAAHPVEHILINLSSVTIGPYLFPCTEAVLYTWIGIATVNSVVSHTDLSWASSKHRVHHKRLNRNFGLLISDYMWGRAVNR